MPCNIIHGIRDRPSQDIKAVITTAEEGSEAQIQVMVAEVNEIQTNVFVWEKCLKIKNKPALQKVLNICKNYDQTERKQPIGILLHKDLETYVPSGTSSGIHMAGTNPTNEAIHLTDDEIKKFLEFETTMIEKFETGLNLDDCNCYIESPFFLIQCTPTVPQQFPVLYSQ